MLESKKILRNYLIWTFIISWILQGIACYFANFGPTTLFSVFSAISMFAPLVGAFLAKAPIKELGWKPKFKGNISYIIAAFIGPALLTILGGILYFVIFPNRFDPECSYVVATYGQDMVDQITAQGLTLPMVLAVSTIQAITYAPFINMFFAVGEEAGWRGVMSPILKDMLGKTKGLLIGGIIWGIWHWPVIIFAGYEYGRGYFCEPWAGMALFCVVTTVWGILLDYLYERTNCIWLPALGHGAINAIAALPMMITDAAYTNQMILGPAPVGIISLIPFAIVAIILLKKKA